MPTLEPILQHIGPYLLVLFRLSGLFIFAPMLASPVVPVQARTLMVFMFTAALYPALAAGGAGEGHAAAASLPADLFSLIPVAFAEVLIGAALGLIAALPMFAVQLGGLISGQQLGLGLAGIYNPALDTDSDVLGQMMVYLAMAIFAAAGGLEVAFLAVARTFEHIPIGAAWQSAAVFGPADPAAGIVPIGDVLLGLVGSGFDVALRVSTPVLGIIMIETLAAAFLMKTIPQINIMSLGFSIKVVLGVGVLAVAIGAISEVVFDDVRHHEAAMLHWASPPPSPAPSPAAPALSLPDPTPTLLPQD